MSTPSISAVAAALEELWAAVRAQHPEVPEVILVPGASGSARGSMLWGHHWAGRWLVGETRVPEIMVSGEGFSRGPVEMLDTVLHEAAHALAKVRGIKDTSRQGRYHNELYKAVALEFGLVVEKDPRNGWTMTSVRDETAARYEPQVKALADVLGFERIPEPRGGRGGRNAGGEGEASNNNGVVLVCPACERKIRLSMTSLDVGPIGCVPCSAIFEPKEESN